MTLSKLHKWSCVAQDIGRSLWKV